MSEFDQNTSAENTSEQEHKPRLWERVRNPARSARENVGGASAAVADWVKRLYEAVGRDRNYAVLVSAAMAAGSGALYQYQERSDSRYGSEVASIVSFLLPMIVIALSEHSARRGSPGERSTRLKNLESFARIISPVLVAALQHYLAKGLMESRMYPGEANAVAAAMTVVGVLITLGAQHKFQTVIHQRRAEEMNEPSELLPLDYPDDPEGADTE
jgi:hypothetical protein